MKIIDFFLEQRVFIQLLIILIIVTGVYSYISLPRALDPEVSFPQAAIITEYSGGSPEEIEKFITIPIEDEIKDLPEIKTYKSISQENISTIEVEFFPEYEDMDMLVQTLINEVNNVADLPHKAERPKVFGFKIVSMPVAVVSLGSVIDEDSFKNIGDDFKDILEKVDGIAKARLVGYREKEVWIELDTDRLKYYGITLNEIAERIRKRNKDMTGGDMIIGKSQYLVRAIGEFESIDDISEMVVIDNKKGGAVKIKDLGKVTFGHEKPMVISRKDGKQGLDLLIFRKKGSNIQKIMKQVNIEMDNFNKRYSGAAEANIVFNTSNEISRTINVLQNNAGIGLIFVLIVLTVFLGFRCAMFAFIGIPFSFLLTFVLMKFFDISINGISLFALILILGMIVDDALIVLENIYRYMEMGYTPKQAASSGVKEVVLPVSASVFTTVAAFLPLLLVSGIVGRYIRELPIVVVIALSASLFESFFCMPSHFSEFGRPARDDHVGERLIKRLRAIYMKVIKTAIRHRFITIFLTIVSLVFSILLIPNVELFPNSDAFPRFDIKVLMPSNSTILETDIFLQKARSIIEGQLPQDDLVTINTYAGMIERNYKRYFGDHYGMVSVMLTEKEEREHTTLELIEMIRSSIENISGYEEVTFERMQEGPPEGPPVEIAVKGDSFSILEDIADRIKDQLGLLDGVVDIADDFDKGRERLKVYLDEEKLPIMNIDRAEAAYSIAARLDGLTISAYRDGDDDIDIIIKTGKDNEDINIDTIENMAIVRQDRSFIPLKEVSDIRFESSPDYLRRLDGKRSITITANIIGKKHTSTTVNREIMQWADKHLDQYPGCSLDFSGEYKKTVETIRSMIKTFSLALFLIYFILGSQFKSFTQPLLIMAAVPFAAIGVLVGLFISRNNFTFPVMLGIVALAGIVVNDSLVLIDFINRYRRSGHSVLKSVIKGGQVRLRPILLTSITTIFGLFPMATGMGGESPIWSPLANAIAWGLSFSTMLTLIVLPVLYIILENIKQRFSTLV